MITQRPGRTQPPRHKISDRTKIRDGQVTNRAVYVAIGIDCEGAKQVLGLWVGPTTGESAPPALRLQQVATPDVLALAVLAIEHPAAFAGERIGVASDAPTGEEAASVLSALLGRGLTARSWPARASRRGWRRCSPGSNAIRPRRTSERCTAASQASPGTASAHGPKTSRPS